MALSNKSDVGSLCVPFGCNSLFSMRSPGPKQADQDIEGESTRASLEWWKSDGDILAANELRYESDAFDSPADARQVLDDLKRLQYGPHPFHGWRALPDQSLESITINEFGLRCRSIDEISAARRCLIMGGSTAWGLGATSNLQTPAALLERRLRDHYEIDCAVINVAEQLFSSIEEIRCFVDCVDVFQPDLVLCISGHNDIYRGYKGYGDLTAALTREHAFAMWGEEVGILDEPSWMRRTLKIMMRGRAPLGDYSHRYFLSGLLSAENGGASLYRRKVEVMNAICLYKGIRVAYVLQPHLFFKTTLSTYEQEYLAALAPARRVHFVAGYQRIRDMMADNRPMNEKIGIVESDSADFFDGLEETVFFDSVHFSDRGYRRYCDWLAELASSMLS